MHLRLRFLDGRGPSPSLTFGSNFEPPFWNGGGCTIPTSYRYLFQCRTIKTFYFVETRGVRCITVLLPGIA